MSNNRLLTDNIIESAKCMASVPLSQSRFSPAVMLTMLKDIVDTQIYPMLVTAQGCNNEVKVTITSDSDGVIEIPTRAYLSGVSKVRNANTGAYYLQCEEEYNDLTCNTFNFLGNKIITRDPDTDFDITYTLRPPNLILEAEAPKILNFNPTTREVETNIAITDATMDIIGVNGYLKGMDIARTATTTATLFTLGGSVVPAIGDYICAVEDSPLIPMPVEVVGLLIRQLANRVLIDLPDEESLKAGLMVESSIYQNVLSMLKPRGKKASVVAHKPLLAGASRRRIRGL